jgi:hypothetical protein
MMEEDGEESGRTPTGMAAHNARLAEKWTMVESRRANTIAPFRKVAFPSSACSNLKQFWIANVDDDGALRLCSAGNVCRMRLAPTSSGDRTLFVSTPNQLAICGEIVHGFEVLKNLCIDYCKPWLAHPRVLGAAFHEHEVGGGSLASSRKDMRRMWMEEKHMNHVSTASVFIFEIKLEQGALHYSLPNGMLTVDFNVAIGSGVQSHAMMFRGPYDQTRKKLIFRIGDSPPSSSSLSDREVMYYFPTAPTCHDYISLAHKHHFVPSGVDNSFSSTPYRRNSYEGRLQKRRSVAEEHVEEHVEHVSRGS